MLNIRRVRLLARSYRLNTHFHIASRTYTRHVKPFVDFERQSVVLPDGSRQIRPLDGPPTVRTFIYPDVLTVLDVFKFAKETAGEDAACIGRRKVRNGVGEGSFEWITYGQAEIMIDEIAQGFREIGLKSGQDEKIGIFMKNRPEWLLIDQACCSFNNISVPLYDTFGDDALSHILNQCEMKAVVCEDSIKVDRLLKLKNEDKLPFLTHLITVEEDPVEMLDDVKRRGKILNVRVMTLKELEYKGERGRHPAQVPLTSDLYTICYTSGTTGLPKGVMITHENVLSALTVLESMPNVMKLRDELVEQFTYFSFLPFAHVFDRVCEIQILHMGGRIGFYSGDFLQLSDDMKVLRPHYIIAVPRVLDKIYAKVHDEIRESPLKKWLFEVALAYKESLYKRLIISTDTWADRIVFRKIREALGGNLQYVAVGSAPLHPTVLKFVRDALGANVVEGYGMTETAIGCTVCLEGEPEGGHVGPPAIHAMIKLIDAPDCGYFVDKNGGEVCVKGPSVTPGYYRNEEETKKTFDEDGWLKTGDIGIWTERGTLKIIDRKKNLFKLAQGEYVAPEHIEKIYERCDLVLQCLVHGDSRQDKLVGIVTPNWENFAPYCTQLGFSGTQQELAQNEAVRDALVARLREQGRVEKLNGYEQIAAVCIAREPFAIENDQLTPTQKYKRRNIVQCYAKEIDEMYKQISKTHKFDEP